jgi:anti-anti-sigma factor
MLTSLLNRWFFQQSRRDAPGDRRRTAARIPRPTTLVPPVRVAVSQTADGMVIRVTGEARANGVRALLDALPAPTACRPRVVTLDLSELRYMSCLALGVLRIYCRRVVRTGGQVRLAKELQPGVKETLRRLSQR